MRKAAEGHRSDTASFSHLQGKKLRSLSFNHQRRKPLGRLPSKRAPRALQGGRQAGDDASARMIAGLRVTEA